MKEWSVPGVMAELRPAHRVQKQYRRESLSSRHGTTCNLIPEALSPADRNYRQGDLSGTMNCGNKFSTTGRYVCK